VLTLGELRAGVLLARSDQSRSARETRLRLLREAFEPIPVGIDVALRFGEVLAWARSQGRPERATDLLIVATAGVTERTLHTLDPGQASLARGIGLEVEGVGS